MAAKTKVIFVKDVASVLQDDYIVLQHWSQLAADMETHQTIISTLRTRMLLGIITFYDVLCEIMNAWVKRLRTTEKVTLHSLFELLDSLHAVDAKELLEAKFGDDHRNTFLGFHKKNFRCRNPVRYFTGRTDISQEICNVLSLSERSDSIHVRGIAVLCGPGGIGKSESARHFIETSAYLYATTVLWIDATNLSRLRSSFQEIAEELQLNVDKMCEPAHLVKKIYQFFSKEDVLLVFDDVMDFESVRRFMPSDSACLKPYVIITSQFQTWDFIKSIVLPPLSLDDSVRSIQLYCSTLTEEDCRLLATNLDGYPLALHEAVGYIKHEKKKIDAKTYIELLKSSSEFLASSKWKSFETSTDYEKTIFTAWDVAKRAIEKDKTNVGETALRLLRIFAYFAQGTNKHWLTGFEDRSGDKIITAALRMLENYSLITVDGNYVEVHSVMQYVVRHNSKHAGLEEMTLAESFGIIKNQSLHKIELNLCTNVWLHAAHYPRFLNDQYSSFKYGDLSLTPLHLLSEGNHNIEVETVVNHFNRISRRDERDQCNRTALVIAAANGNVELAKFLLLKNASTKIRFRFPYAIRPFPTISGLNVMHLPAEYGYLEVVKLLHESNKGLAVDCDNRGRTPVEQASVWGQQDVLDYFIQCKRFDALYKNALRLHCILCRGHKNKLRLPNIGADPQINMDTITTSLSNVKSFLLEFQDITNLLKCKVGGVTALHQACYNSDVELVQFLIDKGASVKVTDDDIPPINSALDSDSLDLLQLLLDNGASPEDAPSTGYTSLHVAVQKNNMKSLQFFVDWYGTRSFPVTIQDENGSTLMHTAAAHGHLEMVSYLAEKGVPLDTPAKLGFTPAFAAACNYYPHVFKFFLKAVSDKREGWQTILDNFGERSLFSMGQVSVAHVLALFDDAELLQLVLSSKHVSPRIGENVSVSLLHTAALGGSLECIMLLLNQYTLNVNCTVNFTEMLATLQKSLSEGQAPFPPIIKILLRFLIKLRWLISFLKVTPYMVAYVFENEDICREFFKRDDFEPLTRGQIITCAFAKRMIGRDTKFGRQIAIMLRQISHLKGKSSHVPSHVAEIFEFRNSGTIEKKLSGYKALSLIAILIVLWVSFALLRTWLFL